MTISTLVLVLFLAPPPEAPRGPVLLDFHAEWCGPCKTMRPVIRELTRRGYPVRTIDVDEDQELASRYEVEAVPTLIVLDADGREVVRREGPQTAADLAKWINQAGRAAEPAPPARTGAAPEAASSRGTRLPSTRLVSETDPAARAGSQMERSRKPWETVVRITVHDKGSLGFGSGTVVKSTEEEAIILTCAHIFEQKNRRRPVPPADYPLPVMVELFDGVLAGPKGQTVHPIDKPYPAEVIDYDFERDVALVRIRPGKLIPYAKVVPPAPLWSPQANFSMMTVGCSHGNDATAWNTEITEPTFRGMPERPGYEAIQCRYSPIQGRSGGGLFTDDGYVAGVCNFAFDKRVSQGLYAHPRSIQKILDRNGYEDIYLPTVQGTRPALADAGNRRAQPELHARGQSPTEGETPRAGDLAIDPITVPPPDILGVEPLDGPSSNSSRRVASVSDRSDAASGQRWTPRKADLMALDPPDVHSSEAEHFEATERTTTAPVRSDVSSILPVAPSNRFEGAKDRPLAPSAGTSRWKAEKARAPVN